MATAAPPRVCSPPPLQVAPEFSALLANTRVRFEQGAVASVQPDCPLQSASGAGTAGSLGGGCVQLSDGRSLPYDYLVLALGAQSATDLVPGAKEHALPFSTYEDFQAVTSALSSAAARRAGLPVRAAVVGGALAGVELAAALRSRLGPDGEVSLLTPGERIMATSATGQRDAAAAALEAAGVRVLARHRVSAITAPSEGEAPLQLTFSADGNGDTQPPPPLSADLVLWTAGQRPALAPAPGAPAGWPVNLLGFAEADATLRLRGHERVFAVGDGATVSGAGGEALPATAQVAFQQADYCAWNLWAVQEGRPLLPFRYQHLGEMMSLGADGASVQLPPLPGLAGPEGSGVTVGGPLAALLRRAAYVYRMPTGGSQLAVGVQWLQRALAELSRPRS